MARTTSHPDATSHKEATAQDDNEKWQSDGLPARAWRDFRSTMWRLRRQLIPHVATGAVIATGSAAEAVAAAGIASPSAAAITAAAAGLSASAITAAAARGRMRRWRSRLIAGGLAAAAWLMCSPYVGVTPEYAGMLMVAEALVAARWWRENRLGYPDDPDAPPAETKGEPVEKGVTQIMADWAAYVACQSGPLAGSKLLAPEKTKHGWGFTLLLAKGKQTVATAYSVLDKIASGLDLDVDEIILEKDPAAKSEARCKFQVITDSPITGNLVFEGPRRVGDNGNALLELGPYADGQGEACYRLYTPGSMWSGVVIGGTGIGKSRVAESIVISALSGGDTELWFLDPQRGASSAALREYADWFVSMDQIDDLLDASIAALDARGEENAYEGWTGFTPSPDRPGLLLLVEECHNAFKHRTADWARIAREGRKIGISILCLSQSAGVDTFGGDDALRSSIMEGNVIAMRSTSNYTGQMMPGLDVDPKTLPKIPGYGYLQGSQETGQRTAPFRLRNTDPDRDGELANAWLSRLSRPGLDTLTVTATLAAGEAYKNRHSSGASSRSASADRIAQLRSGQLPPKPDVNDTETARTGSAGLIEFPTLGGAPLPPVTETAASVDVPAAAPAPVAVSEMPDTVSVPTLPAGYSQSHQRVLRAVAEGASRPKAVQMWTGLGRRRVADILKDLLDGGHLTQPSYGRYRLSNQLRDTA